MEECALKSRLYYDFCYRCDATRKHACYTSQIDLDEHLRSFSELFEWDNGRLEELVEIKH